MAPNIDPPPTLGNARRVLTYNAKTDTDVRDGKPVKHTDPIPA